MKDIVVMAINANILILHNLRNHIIDKRYMKGNAKNTKNTKNTISLGAKRPSLVWETKESDTPNETKNRYQPLS